MIGAGHFRHRSFCSCTREDSKFMRQPHALSAIIALCVSSFCISPVASAQQIDIVNNQPFPIHMPLTVRGVKPAAGATAMQQVGEDAVVIVEAQPSSTSRVQTQIPNNVRMRNRVSLAAKENAVAVTFDGKDL